MRPRRQSPNAARQLVLGELDPELLEAEPHRAEALGLGVVRLDALGPTPVDEGLVEELRARIARRPSRKGRRP